MFGNINEIGLSLCINLINTLKYTTMQPTFFRIDEWNAAGNGSRVHFETTESEALKHVSSMRQITSQETECIEHTSIQPFTADTCDMQGWNNSNADQTEPVHYAH